MGGLRGAERGRRSETGRYSAVDMATADDMLNYDAFGAVAPFMTVLGLAMRTGEPGRCHAPCICDTNGGDKRDCCERTTRSYYVLSADAVEALRGVGTGGIAWCERCHKAIFVAGDNEVGIRLYGMPGQISMKGVQL